MPTRFWVTEIEYKNPCNNFVIIAGILIYFAPRLFSTSVIMSFTSCPTCMKFLYKMRSRSSLDLKVALGFLQAL